MAKGIDILFKFTDAINPDPDLDRACYKTGDMVDFRLFKGECGFSEKPPMFFRVSIPNKARAELEDWFVSLEEFTDRETEEGIEHDSKMLRRKRFNFDPAKLPTRYRDQIYSSGRTVIRWDLFKTCLSQRTN